MKIAVVLVALVALAASAPQPRKDFHEHFEDFLDLVMEESSSDIGDLMEHYLEFEEFRATIDYLQTANFKDLVYEMESLPEFVAVVDFLENDNIDILFFIDLFNKVMENEVPPPRKRHTLSGTNMNAYIKDTIDVFPKAKLSALFEQKKEEDAVFREAVENLESSEWEQIFNALWENEVFQKEVQTLADNGIEIDLVLENIKAIFGQN